MVTKKCRLCLSESLEIQSIFDSHLYQSVPLSLKIAVCISLPITQEDPFSKFVCKKCRMLVDQFYSFRESCMNNYIHLLGQECSRVTEFEELMTISYEAEGCINPNTSQIELGESLHSGTQIDLSLGLENVPGNYIINQNQIGKSGLTKSDSNFVSSDGYNVNENVSGDSKLIHSFTDYQPLQGKGQLIGNNDMVTENDVEPEEIGEEECGNSDTEVAYLEFEEITDCTSQYVKTEEMLEVHQSSDKEDEEGPIYYDQIDVTEEHLHEDELETLVDQGLRIKCNDCLGVFFTADDLRNHYKDGQCPARNVDVEGGLSNVDDETQALDGDEVPLTEGRAKWGEKRKHSCETCSKTFKTGASLRNHRRIHTGERPFLCSLCTQSFSQKGALLNHERKHRGEWPYSCQDCGKGFFRPSDLEKHVRSHTDERPYLCPICSKGFHQLSGLVVHERIHSGERPYSCGICKMTFTQLSNKYRHMKTHAGGLKPFTCDICHRKFVEHIELEMHRAVHNGAKPRICHYCNKGFRKPYELRNHLRRSHTNERPYVCQLCNKSFFVAHDLKNHLYIHTGERPFACVICSQTFTQSGNLKRHHLRHHPGLPLTQISTKTSAMLFTPKLSLETMPVTDFQD